MLVFYILARQLIKLAKLNLRQSSQANSVNGIELKWFRDYYFNHKVQIIHNKYLSESKPLLSGVPQGSILGLLLFIIFFNDIVLELKQSKIIKSADNTVIFFADEDYI